MSRDGSGVYHLPAGLYPQAPNTTIESGDWNNLVADLEQDANIPRPIVAGGTGAGTAAQALINLGAASSANPVLTGDISLSNTDNDTTIGLKQRILLINPTSTPNGGSEVVMSTGDTPAQRYAALTTRILNNTGVGANGVISIATKLNSTDTTLIERLLVGSDGMVAVAAGGYLSVGEAANIGGIANFKAATNKHLLIRQASDIGGSATGIMLEGVNDGAAAVIPIQIEGNPVFINSLTAQPVNIGGQLVGLNRIVSMPAGSTPAVTDLIEINRGASGLVSLGLYQAGVAYWSFGMPSGSGSLYWSFGLAAGAGNNAMRLDNNGALTLAGVLTSTATGDTTLGNTGAGRSTLVLKGAQSAPPNGASINLIAGSDTWFFGFKSSLYSIAYNGNLVCWGASGGQWLDVNYATSQVSLPLAIPSTSYTTGALVVTGGVGITGALNVGMNGGTALNIGGVAAVTNTACYLNYNSASWYGWTIHSNNASTAGAPLLIYNGGNVLSGGISWLAGQSGVSFNTTSDERGKPNRERLSLDYARSIVDALVIEDYDKDGNDIRGIGWTAQQARSVHKSLGIPGRTPDDWWLTEKAAPMPFVIANLQQLNARLDALEHGRQQ